jgi:DNA helicase-2/ATP-dependent DNA helicase PcrA
MADPARPLDPLAHRPRAGGVAARASGAAAAPWLADLNPEQRAAVEATEGAVLVLAGAGTGKTRVLTTRIAHILATGRAKPGQILAVTFTNKAAREMRERIGRLVGQSVEGMPWLGTFHSIGRRILSRHAELAGLSPNFTVLDADDQLRLLRQLVQAEGVDDKRWPARQLAGLIDHWKNRGLAPDKVDPGDAHFYAGGKALKLYRDYQERLKVLNAADFGDLLVEPIRIFREHPEVLAEHRARFRYILVDEYQDTNVAQYLWLRLLAGADGNVCCVGDDDQSIYGWRGAEVDNILRFERDFPGATVVRLERNYRSTAAILAAAAHLIAHNDGRLGKTLFTDSAEAGEKPQIASAWDSEEEARLLGEEIEQLQRRGHALNEMAVLVRASSQMRELEERFVTLGLPYRVIGGPRFYERQEIRDALAYLRCVANPTDDLAFERIVNVPKRGLGDGAVQTLHAAARARGVSLMQAARELVETEELRPKPRHALRDVVGAFARWRAAAETTRHTDLAEIVLDESGYTEMWRNERTEEAKGRLDNLKELVRSMDEFETLEAFLEHVSLVMDADRRDDDDAVSVMTIHAAKGLEFDTVFLPGWEEGLFPSQRALDENGRAGLEEERRLAYVAITRARRRLRVYFAQNRRIHGLWSTCVPSRFLDELPEDGVEVLEGPRAVGYGPNMSYGASRFEERHDPFAGAYATPGWRRAVANRGRMADGRSAHSGGPADRGRHGGRGAVIEGQLVAKSVAEASNFAVGERVFHQKFGYGEVVALEGNKATVLFDKAGEKRVIDSFLERP